MQIGDFTSFGWMLHLHLTSPLSIYAVLPITPYLGSYSLNREFWQKTSLFQKSIGSFHDKVEKDVQQLKNEDRFHLETLQ